MDFFLHQCLLLDLYISSVLLLELEASFSLEQLSTHTKVVIPTTGPNVQTKTPLVASGLSCCLLEHSTLLANIDSEQTPLTCYLSTSLLWSWHSYHAQHQLTLSLESEKSFTPFSPGCPLDCPQCWACGVLPFWLIFPYKHPPLILNENSLYPSIRHSQRSRPVGFSMLLDAALAPTIFLQCPHNQILTLNP